jgi:hypothetical protein
MARPRKDAPAPDSQLVALRLGRDLLAAIDAHAARTGTTRSGALRDLVARGLRSAGRKASDALAPARPCAWCSSEPGAAHREECPHRPGSALHEVFVGRRGAKRS